MRRGRGWPGAVLVSVVLALALPGGPTGAQEREPGTMIALDAELLGGSLSLARQRADGSYHGLGFGLGGSLLTRMVISGSHFSHPGWPSYETKDGSTSQELVEILHLAFFRRWRPSEGATYDVGVRGSLFLHGNSFDDDPALPIFLGGYASAHWGWRRLKVGPRVLAGFFAEGQGAREFGILLVPLTARIEFGW